MAADNDENGFAEAAQWESMAAREMKGKAMVSQNTLDQTKFGRIQRIEVPICCIGVNLVCQPIVIRGDRTKV